MVLRARPEDYFQENVPVQRVEYVPQSVPARQSDYFTGEPDRTLLFLIFGTIAVVVVATVAIVALSKKK